MPGRENIVRAHWDCWSECNLACPFCFRSRGNPLDTRQAIKAIDRLAAGGVAQLAFTGGDPSLRRDLEELVTHAKAVGLAVEVLTNGHMQLPRVISALLTADLVGLSLDGATAAAHDTFRARTGNHRRVLQLIERLENEMVPYVVRTVVSAANITEVPAIGHALRDRHQLVRWSLQQFTPVEMGYANRGDYEISRSEFEACVKEVGALHRSHIGEIRVLSDEGKVGLYLMMNPAGDVFGRVSDPVDGHLPTVGNILQDDFSALVARLQFDPRLNGDRYARWFPTVST